MSRRFSPACASTTIRFCPSALMKVTFVIFASLLPVRRRIDFGRRRIQFVHGRIASESDPDRGTRLFFRKTKRSEEHTSELQSLMRISYAVFCLQTKNTMNEVQYIT